MHIRCCYHCNTASDILSPLRVSVCGEVWVYKHVWVCIKGMQNCPRTQKLVGPLCHQNDGYKSCLLEA